MGSRFFPTATSSGPVHFGPGLDVHPRRADPPGADLSMPGIASAAEALVSRARVTPDRPAFFLIDVEDHVFALSYAQALEGGRRAAAGLQARGARRGQAVVLCLDTSLELLALILGCELLGAVPALIEPPLGLARQSEWPERVRRMLARSGAPLLVVDEALREAAQEAVAGDLCTLACSADEVDASLQLPPGELPGPTELAFLQFTSGTTGHPKGVKISHAALVANARALQSAGAWSSADCMVSWLPLYHDMGLVGGMLAPLVCGFPAVLMSPLSFLFRPSRWLWAMHHFRGTISPAPNFAFQLCLKRVSDEELPGLDLSTWRAAYNGAEMVLPDTVERFFQRFAASGFRAGTMRPCYGMAEVTLAVSATPMDCPPRVDTISRAELAQEGRAARSTPGKGATHLVGVGRPLPGFEVRIAGPGGVALPERAQGEIWVRGPSLFSGYVGEEGNGLHPGGWLRTGDLGYLAEGELFIAGRIKDLVIKSGRNYAPYDLEAAAGRVPGVRGGCVAALGMPDEESGTESVVIVFETSIEETARWGPLVKAVGQAVFEAVGIRPDRILPAPARSLPKTSSGKLMRPTVAELVRSGALPPLLNLEPPTPPPR